MKLQGVVLAGVMLWLAPGTQANPLEAGAATAPARGLDAALAAGLGSVSFEASAALGAQPVALPALREAGTAAPFAAVPFALTFSEPPALGTPSLPGDPSIRPPGTPTVSPVPEPNTVSLMLAGLAVLVVLFSRRRRGS